MIYEQQWHTYKGIVLFTLEENLFSPAKGRELLLQYIDNDAHVFGRLPQE